MVTSNSSLHSIALALCDGLLMDIERAKSSASLNRGMTTIGIVYDHIRAIGTFILFSFLVLAFLSAYVSFWLAVMLVLLGDSLIITLWVLSHRGQRRSSGPNLLDANDETTSTLDASLSQLNGVIMDMQTEGVEIRPVDFRKGNLVRLRRDVIDTKARLERLL